MTPADRACLAKILAVAHRIERLWQTPRPNASSDNSRDARHRMEDLSANADYAALRSLINDCSGAETESLRRLAPNQIHLRDQVTLAHFYSCLVPFERLANKAPRDDEFLVAEGDRLETTPERIPLKLVVENVRSAFNVGALFRTAECLGVAEIILCGYTPGPDDEKTARTAMGTAAFVPWRRVDRASTAFGELRSEGFTLVALETAEAATSLYEADFSSKPTAFILGNERFGLEGTTLEAADLICRIPVSGVKNSMNVGVAFGIAAFEWRRQFLRATK